MSGKRIVRRQHPRNLAVLTMSLLFKDKGTMTRKLVLTLSMLVLTAALLLSVPASADSIDLTLANPLQVAGQGSTVTFTATVNAPATNSSTIYLNSDSFIVDAPLALDDSGFLLTFPLFMNPGDTYTGVLFTVNVPLSAPLGVYNGSFQILGGGDGGTLDPISTVVPFQVTVVPEPGSLMLLGTGALGLFGVVRRKL